MNMKMKVLLTGIFSLGILSSGVTATEKKAAESIFSIQQQAKIKAEYIRLIKAQIESQKNMQSADQVRAQIEKGLAHNRQLVMSSHSAAAAKASLTRLDQLAQPFLNLIAECKDKDTIIAIEQAELEALMSSENYMFMATSAQMKEIDRRMSESSISFLDPIALFFTIPIDLATLPFTFLLTVITGGDPQAAADAKAREDAQKEQAKEKEREKTQAQRQSNPKETAE